MPISVGQLNPTAADQIIQDVVATVLDITVAAWPHLRKSRCVGPSDKEDDITNRLRWEMEAEKQRRDPSPQLRFEREVQVDDPESDYPTGRIDVYVIYSLDGTGYFAMECKKVTDHHKKHADYYIQEGICRFSSGKYSLGHPCGAMIAFVTDGTAEAAADFLGRKIFEFDKNETKIKTDWDWQPEKQFGHFPNLFSTMHGQTGTRNTILLLHLFLPFLIEKTDIVASAQG